MFRNFVLLHPAILIYIYMYIYIHALLPCKMIIQCLWQDVGLTKLTSREKGKWSSIFHVLGGRIKQELWQCYLGKQGSLDFLPLHALFSFSLCLPIPSFTGITGTKHERQTWLSYNFFWSSQQNSDRKRGLRGKLIIAQNWYFPNSYQSIKMQ